MRKLGLDYFDRWGWDGYTEAVAYADETDTYVSEPSDSELSLDDEHRYIIESVVLRCRKVNRTVAYIVPKPKRSADPVTHIIVYTNSSALPLLVSVKSKIARGG